MLSPESLSQYIAEILETEWNATGVKGVEIETKEKWDRRNEEAQSRE